MYSREHLKFIKKIKKEKRIIRLFQILIVLLFIIIWQILADLNVINTFIFSSPKMVIKTIISLHNDNNLYHHIWVTTYETLISFSLGTILGCLIASILWWNRFIAKIFDPYLTILNSLPKVALGPIIIALLISVIITIINVNQAFNDVDRNKIKLMNSFNATKWQTYFKLILPSSFNTIINSLKINISMSLIGS